jgi:hypothetical protein
MTMLLASWGSDLNRGFVRQREMTSLRPYKALSNMQLPFPQRALVPPEILWQFIFLAASSPVCLRLRVVPVSAPVFNVESVFRSLRPERTDSQTSTPSYVLLGMEMSLLVRARGPMCLDALIVGPGVGVAPAVAGPGPLNMSSNGHIIISPKVTPDAVLPFVELVESKQLRTARMSLHGADFGMVEDADVVFSSTKGSTASGVTFGEMNMWPLLLMLSGAGPATAGVTPTPGPTMRASRHIGPRARTSKLISIPNST